MPARLKTLWESLQTSLWFFPGIMALGAAGLAWFALVPHVDLPAEGTRVWWLFSGDSRNAASLLSALFTSMITLATLAISITMVVLTLAARQLGPRLIRSFMADRRSQLMLGFLLATIVYLVLVLRTIDGGATDGGAPQLAVTIGTGLVLVCVFVLLFFVHHLARAIVSDTVIQRVGHDLDSAIRDMLPEAGAKAPAAGAPAAPRHGGAAFGLVRGGYVQAIGYGALVDCARAADAVIELGFRPGHHVLPGGEHGRVYPASALTDAVRKAIAEAVVVGSVRTPTQDLEFAVRQLVEIALRALSPGVVDPFTAVAVIDRLGVSLALMMGRGPAPGVWSDADGGVRVIGPATTFRGAVDAAFNQIRQAGEGQPAVLIRLLATFAKLAGQVRDDDHRHVLAEHVAMVMNAAERSVEEDYDFEAIEAREAAARQRLGDLGNLGDDLGDDGDGARLFSPPRRSRTARSGWSTRR